MCIPHLKLQMGYIFIFLERGTAVRKKIGDYKTIKNQNELKGLWANF